MATTSINSCKQCRREGRKLFLKGDRCYTSKCAVTKRNTLPGVHGSKGRPPRLSGYGLQLRAKQSAKRTYGLLERQFHLYYERSKASTGKTGEVMLQMLEGRLDNVVYRSGLASSRSQARQLVSHGHFQLNGQNVDIPSIQIQSGDVLTVKPTKKEENYWKNLPATESTNAQVPVWLNTDRKQLLVKVNQLPTIEMISSDIQMNLIIELYSL